MAVTISGANGIVLQVGQSVLTSATTTTTTGWMDTGLSVTLTPASSSSKFLVSGVIWVSADANRNVMARLTRNGTTITNPDVAGSRTLGFGGLGGDYGHMHNNNVNPLPITYLDAPATTSAVTYKIQWYNPTTDDGTTAALNRTIADTDAVYNLRVMSYMTVQEISQ